MKEKYLHYIWKNKMLPFYKMTTDTGDCIRVDYPGDYNAYAGGPDFFNAKIHYQGLLWIGSVEIHINASDWYAHKHHQDIHYNNVILHVVWNNDKKIIQNGRILPTLEIKHFVADDHVKRFSTTFRLKRPLLCGSQLSIGTGSHHLKKMFELSLKKRLERKIETFMQLDASKSDCEILYYLMARAMGTNINAEAFDAFAVSNNLQKINDLFYNLEFKAEVNSSVIYNFIHIYEKLWEEISWQKGGVRPSNSFEQRKRQFLFVLIYIDFSFDYDILTANEILSRFEEITKEMNCMIQKTGYCNTVSASFVNLLIINAIAPFLYFLGMRRKDSFLIEKSKELLRNCPAEINHITKLWKSYSVHANSAFETQGMLELYRSYCEQKKCLSCSVGKSLLSA